MERCKYKMFKYKKAQQLIEFLLVAPFMIIILGILTEYAYALNINMTLKEGLKTTTASIYSEIQPGMTAEQIRALAETNLTSYLAANNAPTASENNISVGYATSGQTAVFMATYNYIPAFTLPSVYINFLPKEFTFFATSAIPSAFLGDNKPYSTSTINKSIVLDGIWQASKFSSLADFDGIKYGVMSNNTNNTGRKKTIFLVPSPPPASSIYALVHWDGTVDKCNFNSTTGTLANSATGSGNDCGIYNGRKFIDYLEDPSNNYYNIIFVRDSDLVNLNPDLSNLSDRWVTNSNVTVPTINVGTTDISAATIDGILKRYIALIGIGSPASSIGDYDNSSAQPTPTIMPFGSMVFVGTDSTTFKIITTGASVPSISSFNSESL